MSYAATRRNASFLPKSAKALSCAMACALLMQGAHALTSSATVDEASGNGFYTNTDYSDAQGRLTFSRSTNTVAAAGGGFLGSLWRTNFDANAAFSSNTTLGQVEMIRPDGRSVRFGNPSTTFDANGVLLSITPGTYSAKAPGSPDVLIVKTSTGVQGPLASLIYRNIELGREEVYDAQGRLVRFVYKDGYSQDLARNVAGQVTSVSDSNGRVLSFTYASFDRIASITDPGGATHTFTWETAEGGNPNKLLQTSSPQGVRSYNYIQNAKSGIPIFASVEVGIGAERIIERSISAKSTNGSAFESGGVSGVKNVFRRSVSTTSLDVKVTENGLQTHRWYEKVGGRWKFVKQDNPAGSGCQASSSNTEYDSNGFVVREDDFNGNRACYVRNPIGNPLVSATGLSADYNCSDYLNNFVSWPADAVKLTAEYHPVWNTISRIAGPKRIQTTINNGQPDPFNGNAILTCAPDAPALPSGIPLSLPCKVVTQGTSDPNGTLGFNAQVDSAYPIEVKTYQYDALGQLKSFTRPGYPAVNFTFYSDGELGNKKGDLKSTIDAEGFSDVVNSYDAHGHPLMLTRADGGVTTYTYNNMRLIDTMTVDGLTTRYEYNSLGEMTKVVSSDGTETSFVYAQQTPSAPRQLSNSTLANSGQLVLNHHDSGVPTLIQWRKSDGAIDKEISRKIDALGRVYESRGQ